MGQNMQAAVKACREASTLSGLVDFAARAFGSVAGGLLSIEALPNTTWAKTHGGAPKAREAVAVALREFEQALEALGASPREALEAKSELWGCCARAALLDGAPALKYKRNNPKKAFAWLVEGLVDEQDRAAWAPAVAAAHLGSLVRGARSEDGPQIRGWDAPLFRDDAAWGFHIAAIEWALERSSNVDLSASLLEKALAERVEDLEGDPERQESARHRMRELRQGVERCQINSVLQEARASKSAPRL